MSQLSHLEKREMQASKSRQALVPLSLFLLAALSAAPALAQQLGSASKSAEISAFGGYTNINSDYGTRNNGITIGADYTRFFHFPVAPSFEVRANRTSGLGLTEESVLFGLRLEAPFRQRFHPYITALYGGTKILFKMPPTPTYTYDQTSATSLGGGIDFDVTHNFRAKFDFQQQFEDFGPNGIHQDFTLTPAGFTVGVVYRIPFKPRQGFK
jgi:Outer membrane protein beta-barrel domain